MSELSLDDLARNGTLSPAIARTMREAVALRRSFVCIAIPRLAGKSTVMHAMLAHAPKEVGALTVTGERAELARIAASGRQAYLVVPEIADSGVPGYLWGAPVRRVFAVLGERLSLATAMHAPGADEAFAKICVENRVPDEQAAQMRLAVYIRSLGVDWQHPTRRVVASVHAVEGVAGGKPRLRLLHRWDERTDRFEDLEPA